MKAYRRVILRCVFLCAPVFFLYNCTTLEEGFEFEAIPAISGLDCNKYRLTGFLTELQAAQGVVVKVPYQSSNGLYYPGEVVESDGVDGLTARLEALTFRTSPDSLTYIITGTPATAGTARFRLGAGRDSCDLNLVVGSRVGTVTNLGCGSPTVNGTLFAYVAAAGVTVTITYSGGNGGTYGSGEFSSTGVGGLKAVLTGGQLNQGAGSVNLTITGTPNGAGSANFPLVIAGSSCVLNLSVILPAASVENLHCMDIQINGSIYQGNTVNDVSFILPYSGGNGGNYSQQSVQSDPNLGVGGLLATLDAGSTQNGNGSVIFRITGTANSIGAAIFPISLGGKFCNAKILVGGIFVDNRDGKQYETAAIGSNIWFIDNLNYNIPGSYCYADNPENCNIYGRLYNYTQIMVNSGCPTGWRMASMYDFFNLLESIGSSCITCDQPFPGEPENSTWGPNNNFTGASKLKAQTGWVNDNSNNNSQFSALPGGYKHYSNPSYIRLGAGGAWWLGQLPQNQGEAIVLYLSSGGDVLDIVETEDKETDKFSIRCIKN